MSGADIPLTESAMEMAVPPREISHSEAARVTIPGLVSNVTPDMPHLPEDTNPDAWHRYFAMECNNRAWEIAYVHSIHAHAAAISGETLLHNESYAAASAAVEAISDDEDRNLVLKTFEQVPPP